MPRAVPGVALAIAAVLLPAACQHDPPPPAIHAAPAPDPYSPHVITARFTAALAELGLTASALEVDTATSPPVLFGVIDGTRDWNVLRDVGARMGAPYRHGGAVTHGDGVNRMAFAIDLLPARGRSAGTTAQAGESTLARLEALAQRARQRLSGGHEAG